MLTRADCTCAHTHATLEALSYALADVVPVIIRESLNLHGVHEPNVLMKKRVGVAEIRAISN
jgi:hypothetical protein